MITQAYRLLDPQLFRHNIFVHKVINDYIMLSTFHVNRTYDSIYRESGKLESCILKLVLFSFLRNSLN